MANEPQKVIEVKNVRKIYRMGTEKIYAVDDVSFEICEGEFCCLLGTSGSGKSTLLNLMAGIEKVTSGQILIKGRPIHKLSETKLARFRQKYLGFVFQSYNLIGTMTALENVELPLVFKRLPKRRRRSLAREMLIKVGLKNRMHHKPKEMSGGQQQRVGIARAFVARPSIVFADEPTGNLDTKTTMEVMELIRQIAKDNRQTIVMVTHDRRLAEFADRIIHVLDGKIQKVELVSDKRELTDSFKEDLKKPSEDSLEQEEEKEAEDAPELYLHAVMMQEGATQFSEGDKVPEDTEAEIEVKKEEKIEKEPDKGIEIETAEMEKEDKSVEEENRNADDSDHADLVAD